MTVVLVLLVVWLASGPVVFVFAVREPRRESMLDEIARRELAGFFAEWDALVEGASS